MLGLNVEHFRQQLHRAIKLIARDAKLRLGQPAARILRKILLVRSDFLFRSVVLPIHQQRLRDQQPDARRVIREILRGS